VFRCGDGGLLQTGYGQSELLSRVLLVEMSALVLLYIVAPHKVTGLSNLGSVVITHMNLFNCNIISKKKCTVFWYIVFTF